MPIKSRINYVSCSNIGSLGTCPFYPTAVLRYFIIAGPSFERPGDDSFVTFLPLQFCRCHMDPYAYLAFLLDCVTYLKSLSIFDQPLEL